MAHENLMKNVLTSSRQNFVIFMSGTYTLFLFQKVPKSEKHSVNEKIGLILYGDWYYMILKYFTMETVFVVVFCICWGPNLYAQQDIEWKTYINPEHRITLKYPSVEVGDPIFVSGNTSRH